MRIKCCKGCVPPKRHLGCHSECETYQQERKQINEARTKMHEQNVYNGVLNKMHIHRSCKVGDAELRRKSN